MRRLGNTCRLGRQEKDPTMKLLHIDFRRTAGCGLVMTKFVSATARILLGLTFLALGFNGFEPFVPLPPSAVPNARASFGGTLGLHLTYLGFDLHLISELLLRVNRITALVHDRLNPPHIARTH
jgi:hypothetical protein